MYRMLCCYYLTITFPVPCPGTGQGCLLRMGVQ
jgi:hypothetical protein